MIYAIPERDWKIIRALKESAVNTACERIFQKIEKLIRSRGTESHKYYLKLWKLLPEQDREISLMFDDFKRSNAVFKISVWKKNGIISDETLQELTEETQRRIEMLSELEL